MAKNGGSAVSPRRIIAGGFIFVGLFAMCFGLGSRSQALMVVGAAVIVLAFSVRLFSSVRRSPRQWVLGTGQVIEVSGEPPSDLPYGRCTIHLSVDAPGLPTESVHVTDNRVPVGLWPYPSQELPVEVASDDPRHVRIRWNQLAPTGAGSDAGGQRTGQAGAGYAGDPGYAGGDAPDPDGFGPNNQDPDARERAAASPAREVRIDFDLDRPPPAAPRMDPEQAATRPIVAPLPAELGESGGYGGPTGPDLPRPRRRPRPYPGQTQEPAALPAGSIPDGAGPDGGSGDAGESGDVGRSGAASGDLDNVEGSGDGTGTSTAGSVADDSPDSRDARKPADLPEPVLAGAAVGAAGSGGPAARGASTGGTAGGGAGAPAAAAAGSRAASGTASRAASGTASSAASGAAPGAASGSAEDASSRSQTGPVGTFTNVGITVLVSDLHRSVAFYRDQLGFYEVDGGAGNAVLASGETRLVLRAAPDLKKTRHRSVYLNLEVEDLEAVYTELRAGGVGFTNPPRRVDRTERLELWAATFRDPDGNGIALTQWRPSR